MILDLIAGKTKSEIADIKASEIAKVNHVGTYTDKNDFQIEIISLTKISGGVEVLARVHYGQDLIGFGDGSVEIERFRIINPPILTGVGLISTQGRLMKEDPAQAIRDAVSYSVKAALAQQDKIYGLAKKSIVPGRVGSTVTTVYGSVDGRTAKLNANASWATIIAATGDSVNNAGPDAVLRFNADTVSNQWDHLMRYICIFDTSSIPDGDTISAATVMLENNGSKSDPNSNTPNLDIYVATPASDLAIAATDYGNIGTTSQTGSPITYANLPGTDGGEATWTLNATGRGNISKTGNTRWGWRNANYDVAAVAPTWGSSSETRWDAYFVDAVGTTKDPVMVITHAPAVTGNFFQFFGPQPQV